MGRLTAPQPEELFAPAPLRARVQYPGLNPAWISFESVDEFINFKEQTIAQVFEVETKERNNVEIKLEELGMLSVIARLEPEAYGVTVQEYLEPKSYSLGEIYVMTQRLQEKGFLRGELTDPLPERGNHSKLLWFLTDKGREALRQG